MRDDIYGGLKNAIERGISLDQAVRSFINAGYSESEVREAAKAFAPPTLSVTNPPGIQRPMTQARPPQQPQLQPQTQSPVQQMPQTQVASLNPPAKKSNTTVILLIAVLIILVGVFIASLLFRNQIASVLKTALG